MVLDGFLKSSGWWGDLNKFLEQENDIFEEMSKNVKVLDGGAVSINSWGQKTTFKKQMSQNVIFHEK